MNNENFDIPFRIGHGYDVHRFAQDRPLFLAGVEIPSDMGLDGHSDADVVLHAVCDAILGAIGEDDIGQLFPNTDERWRGCASSVFLCECLCRARERGWKLGNLDITLIAETPKISPHYGAMRCAMVEHTGLNPDCIGIKATTNEKMGFLGRGEGMAAFAVVLMVKISA